MSVDRTHGYVVIETTRFLQELPGLPAEISQVPGDTLRRTIEIGYVSLVRFTDGSFGTAQGLHDQAPSIFRHFSNASTEDEARIAYDDHVRSATVSLPDFIRQIEP